MKQNVIFLQSSRGIVCTFAYTWSNHFEAQQLNIFFCSISIWQFHFPSISNLSYSQQPSCTHIVPAFDFIRQWKKISNFTEKLYCTASKSLASAQPKVISMAINNGKFFRHIKSDRDFHKNINHHYYHPRAIGEWKRTLIIKLMNDELEAGSKKVSSFLPMCFLGAENEWTLITLRKYVHCCWIASSTH